MGLNPKQFWFPKAGFQGYQRKLAPLTPCNSCPSLTITVPIISETTSLLCDLRPPDTLKPL